MSITSTSPIAAAIVAPPGAGTSGPAALRGRDFSSILEQTRGAVSDAPQNPAVKAPFDIKAAEQLLGVDLHREIVLNRTQALGGATFNARELLAYQIKAGELSLRVEMLSKVADSLTGTIRKLQSQP